MYMAEKVLDKIDEFPSKRDKLSESILRNKFDLLEKLIYLQFTDTQNKKKLREIFFSLLSNVTDKYLNTRFKKHISRC